MDADGFIRTLSGDEAASVSGSNSDSSGLEFRDEGSDEEAAAPFFAVAPPTAWNLRDVRGDAAVARPFQTSIDHKISAARAAAALGEMPGGGDDNDDEEGDGDDEVGMESEEYVEDADVKAKAKSVTEKEAKMAAKKKAKEVNGEGKNGGVVTEKEAKKAAEKKVKEEKAEAKEAAEAAAQKSAKRVGGKKRARKEAIAAAATFESLNLSRALLKAVETLQWEKPTPVQARAIPYILAGRDVCGSAVTGSGKTAAFLLPILERLIRSGVDGATRVIILLPTRELAAQCHAVIVSLAKYTSIRSALAVGGLSNSAQELALRSRPHVIVATPGRLIDHVRNAQSFSLEDIEILVMDEADRLLELGFKAEVEEIIRCTPLEGRQTLLFSATMTQKLGDLINLSLQNPMQMAVDPMFDVATTLSQEFVKLKETHEANKDAVLFALTTRVYKTKTIIFFRQKVTAHRFKILFGLSDLRCAELHGNLTQAQRLEALDLFREGNVDFLLCTDLAARGLDIAGVDAVINYDMPSDVIEYVHRVGRTARAGAVGRACSIVCSSSNDERRVLKNVAKRAKRQLSARVVQPAVVGKWRAWIDSLEGAIKNVFRDERQEKDLRMAEMELNKADNLLKHSDEIYSRPARTWFQTQSAKDEARVSSRAAQGIAPRTARPVAALRGSQGPLGEASRNGAGKPAVGRGRREPGSRENGRKRKMEMNAQREKQNVKREVQRDYGKQRSSKSRAGKKQRRE